MSTKHNKAIQVDREALATLQVYVGAVLTEIEQTHDSLKASCAYLLDDENVSGGDSKEFKSGIEAILSSVLTVGQKFQAVDTSVRRINEIAGVNSSANKVSLAEARKDMGAHLMKLKQAGR